MGSAFAGLVVSTHPAAALDDGSGNSFLDVLDLVGLGPDKEDKVIQYRERAPLVLPPKQELRQPVPPVAQRTTDWPQDAETVRAAKKAQDNRYRAAAERDSEIRMAGKLPRMGRISADEQHERNAQDRPCSMSSNAPNPCDPNTFWSSLKQKSGTSEVAMQPGVEPDRRYLTQPPKGYMAPKKMIAANSKPVAREEGGVFDYFTKRSDAE